MGRATALRRNSDDKRQAIFDAALELFGHYGYRRTSVDDIARQAGIAKGTIYLYVQNKEALFRELSRALLERVIDDAQRAAAGKGTATERLYAVLVAKFGFFHDLLHRSPHASELLDSKNRLCADVFAEGDAAYLQVLTKAITEATRRAEVAPRQHGLGAKDVAAILAAAAHGIDVMPGTSLSGDEFRERLEAFVRVMVAGLAPR